MKVTPLHDRLLVKRVAVEEKTKGGIIIPESGKEKPAEAKVVAVGPGKRSDDGKLVKMDVKKGDRIAGFIPNMPEAIIYGHGKVT